MPVLAISGAALNYTTYSAQNMGDASRVRPLILFVHGAGTASHRWRHQVQDLGASYFCMAIDLPWHGCSAGLNDFPTVANYAGVLGALWEAARRQWRHISGLVVVGEQLGAAAALEFARQRPPGLSGLVLVSAGVRMTIPRDWLAALRQGIIPMEMAVQVYHPTPYAYWQQDHALDVGNCPPAIRYLDHLALNAYEAPPDLSAVAMPVLLLYGAKDAVLNEELAVQLTRRIRGADLQYISGGGHALAVQKPREVAAAVRGFLSDKLGWAIDEGRKKPVRS